MDDKLNTQFVSEPQNPLWWEEAHLKLIRGDIQKIENTEAVITETRNTEDEQTIQNRLKITQKELEVGKKFKYSVVNDSVENAVEQIRKIINRECEC